MCTVQSIKDAIRENCQSQYDMESTDIDRVLQTLPFSGHESLFDQPPLPTRPPAVTAAPDGLSAGEKRVYDCIAAAANGLVLDEIAAALKLPPSQVMPLLSNLEIQEYIRSAEGGKYLKA